MSRPPSVRTTRLVSGALLALLGAFAAAPSTAEAGCGHYIVFQSNGSGIAALSDMESLRLLGVSGDDTAPAAPPRDVPCSGPTCSQGPGVPYVPAPLPSVRSELWCGSTAPPPPDGPGLSDRLPEPARLHPVRRPFPLERPPRLPS